METLPSPAQIVEPAPHHYTELALLLAVEQAKVGKHVANLLHLDVHLQNIFNYQAREIEINLRNLNGKNAYATE